MQRPTRQTENRRPAPRKPQTTKAQVRLSQEEFCMIMGWPAESHEAKALEYILRSVPGTGRLLNQVVNNYLWTMGKERFRSGCRQWNRAMRELVAYEEQYEVAGRKQGKKSVSQIANTKPEVFKCPEAQRKLILDTMKVFYGSNMAQVSDHPGDKPEGKEAIKQWQRQLKRHNEETAWAAGFPQSTLFHGTLLNLLLIRLCSTEQKWAKFQEAWSAVEGGVELPEVVTNLRIGPAPEQQEESVSA